MHWWVKGFQISQNMSLEIIDDFCGINNSLIQTFPECAIVRCLETLMEGLSQWVVTRVRRSEVKHSLGIRFGILSWYRWLKLVIFWHSQVSSELFIRSICLRSGTHSRNTKIAGWACAGSCGDLYVWLTQNTLGGFLNAIVHSFTLVKSTRDTKK